MKSKPNGVVQNKGKNDKVSVPNVTLCEREQENSLFMMACKCSDLHLCTRTQNANNNSEVCTKTQLRALFWHCRRLLQTLLNWSGITCTEKMQNNPNKNI